MKAQDMTINYTDFEVDRLTFTELEDNSRSKGQKIAYPRYDHPRLGANSPLLIQTPWIDLDFYGVPRLGEYYSDDSQRSFLKTPLNQSKQEIKEFTDIVLKAIDTKIASDDVRKLLFGSKSDKYTEPQYTFRTPQEEEDNSKNKNKKNNGPKPAYMKLKIDTTFPENKIKTIVFNSVMQGSKRIRTKIEGIETIDDFARNVCYLSRIRPIIRLVKLWAQAPNKKDPTYGVTFKIVKIEVEPPAKVNTNMKQYLESDAFLDSDEESDKVTPAIKTTVKDESSDSESDEPKKNIQTKPKQVAQVDSDDSESDSESDEPIKVAKAVIKQTKKVDSDSDDSEEETKKKVNKKPVTKTRKASA